GELELSRDFSHVLFHDDLTFIEDDDTVDKIFHVLDLVCGYNNQLIFVQRSCHDFAEDHLGGDIQAVRRFVQHQQSTFGCQCKADEELLLLSVRKLVDCLVLRQFEFVKQVFHELDVKPAIERAVG